MKLIVALLFILLLPTIVFALQATEGSADFEDSSSESLQRNDEAQLDITADMTISTWARFETLNPTERALVSKWDIDGSADANRSYLFQTVNNGLRLQMSNTSSAEQLVQVTWAPATSTWYHLAVVYRAAASDALFYVNGVQQGATQDIINTNIRNSTLNFYLGVTLNAGTPNFAFMDGNIADVRMWSRALSPQEMMMLYTTPCSFDNGPGLAAWWMLNNQYNKGTTTLTLTNNNTVAFVQSRPYHCFNPYQFTDF